MPAKLHSVLTQDVTLAVSARQSIDLPVNPLSAIFLTLRARDTGAATSPRATLAAFLGLLSNIAVKFKGSDIINASAVDLFVAMAFLSGKMPRHNVMINSATATRFVTIPIQMGRKLYWPEEAFPATRKGELQLIVDPAASFAGFDTVSLQVETAEILDAQPTRFTKITTLARTFPATGQNDIDLPLGNPLLGITLFGTTFPDGGSFNSTWGQVRLLVDNVPFTYTETNWETLQNEIYNRLNHYFEQATHAHIENLAAAYAQNATTEVPAQARDLFRQYAYLDFDPLGDGAYALQTEGRGNVKVRANADVADAARILPVELVMLTPAG